MPETIFTGTMGIRLGLLLLSLLSVAWTGDASGDISINIETSDASAVQIIYEDQEQVAVAEAYNNPDVCNLCEEYTGLALNYLNEEKTQREITDILHGSCSQLHSYKQQCTAMVDYYAPILFLELMSVEPQELCNKLHLCQKIAMIASQINGNSCDYCHQTISELLVKLKDPDNQMEIIETLLKLCSNLKNNAKKCKSLVFHYGPLVLANAEKFFEKTDICTIIHACKASTSNSKLASVMEDMSLVTDF